MASKYCDRVEVCKHNRWCADDYNPERDNHECFIQLTNADRIRALSDEELAEMLEELMVCGDECPADADCHGRTPLCKQMLLDWLQSPAEGGTYEEISR